MYRYDQTRRRLRPHEPGPAVAEIIRRLVDGGLTCYLCVAGTPAAYGVYVPADQAAAGAPRGKVRSYWYALCSACLDTVPDVQAVAEARVAAEIAAGRN
jgi:hypothetical protein